MVKKTYRGYKAGYKTQTSTGSPARWNKYLSRINVTFPEELFADIRLAALQNNRSVSREISHRVARSLEDEKK